MALVLVVSMLIHNKSQLEEGRKSELPVFMTMQYERLDA